MAISIGIRELRQHASRYLRRVREGETVTITDRGEPIADIVPRKPGRESTLERLIREGKARPAKGDLMEFLRENPPLQPEPGEPLPSEILEELRRDER